MSFKRKLKRSQERAGVSGASQFNYIEQIRAFERRVAADPYKLSRSAQTLWYRLHRLADLEGGSFNVSAENHSLALSMSATEKTLLVARTELEESRLISYERGIKSAPSKYTLTNISHRCWLTPSPL